MLLSQSLRYDLYKNVHKGLRRELSILVADFGMVDPADERAVRDAAERWRRMDVILVAHTLHEDRHLGPHLRRLVPDLYTEMEAEHEALDTALDELRAAAHAVALGRADERARDMRAFYLRLASFVGRYFVHLNREETEYLAAFHAGFTDAEIGAIEADLVAHIEPALLDAFLAMMGAAMSAADHREMAAMRAA